MRRTPCVSTGDVETHAVRLYRRICGDARRAFLQADMWRRTPCVSTGGYVETHAVRLMYRPGTSSL